MTRRARERSMPPCAYVSGASGGFSINPPVTFALPVPAVRRPTSMVGKGDPTRPKNGRPGPEESLRARGATPCPRIGLARDGMAYRASRHGDAIRVPPQGREFPHYFPAVR